MRMIVHLGFHKTASSHFQGLLNRNHHRLARRGIWYARQKILSAHHHIANPLLSGDAAPLAAMIGEAKQAECHTIIFSSENLEALPFNPPIAALLEQSCADHGISEIEWHAVIREPGAYFASLHSQLCWHTYADSLHMFSEVMKKGVLFLPEPHSGEGATPYWFFCFDYLPFLASFAEARQLFVHDYADRTPFPGWRLMERLGALDALVRPPKDWESNHRLDRGEAEAKFRERLADATGDPALWEAVKDAAERNIAASIDTVPVYAEAVGRRYAESYRGALAAFGPDAKARARTSSDPAATPGISASSFPGGASNW